MEKNNPSAPVGDDKTLVAGLTSNKTQAHINLVGKCFNNRYLIESQIGNGGMSDIYRAKDLHLEAEGIDEPYVAIKVLQQEFSQRSEAKQLLIKEARKTQQLSHPNIIRVYDVDADGDYHFMVMEWLDGEPLDQVIKRSKPLGLPFKGVLKLLQQIAAALIHAHKVGIVHTDLKPSNIILTRGGDIKVFDFGVARAMQLNVDQYAMPDKQHTTPHSGYTPAYASLEQLEGKPPCVADDIYAFSCIIYELLTGKHPYQRVAANKVDLKKIPLVKPKHINFYYWLTLKKGLALNKAERSADVSEMLKVFSRCLWPKILAAAAGIVLFVGVVQVYQTQEQTIKNLSRGLAENTSKQAQLSTFEQLTTLELLSRLDNIPREHALIKQGLLRSHQQKIIDIVEQKIEQVPKDAHGVYKNYDDIEVILADALLIFPDSMRLIQMLDGQRTSRLSIVDALAERLNLLLVQGRYQESGDNHIPRLVEDLNFLDTGFEFQPEEQAFTLYQENFDRALLHHDVNEITVLIGVGELVFIHVPEAEPLLALGKSMKASVAKLAAYNEKIVKGQLADYPYQAAEVFYQKTFEQFSAELQGIEDHTQLTQIDENVAELAKLLPGNFQPLVTIEKRIAGLYLRHANLLMDKKHYKAAQKLVKRGNELYDQINQISVL
ncbi:serine/threonine-protein kinase [Thalassomonas haliotis]|uniref:Serine/threonine protein kinase n=1 Tax=Thalassomonas haliotis TaxID=485448 RepID=A0ABY7VMM5_9GAMM|nr:serine/threonine-protein kinase [Thalassomonas haliotis]WDE13872.1 serine/threonine protein kinase [Thalassomonas haliotis]